MLPDRGRARAEDEIDEGAGGTREHPGMTFSVALERANCYRVATRTPGTRRIQEDIQLGRGADLVYAWIALGTLSTWIGTVRNQWVSLVRRPAGARLAADLRQPQNSAY